MSDTRKVVINVCFGGFGLSDEAKRRLIGCGHITLMEPAEYYGHRKGWRESFARDAGNASFGICVHDGKILVDGHDRESRDCPTLVRVVEDLGEAANGPYAKLRVVSIPASVDWEIDDYDGNESIDEKHRTWR